MEECTLLEQLKSRGGNKIRKAAKLFYIAKIFQLVVAMWSLVIISH